MTDGLWFPAAAVAAAIVIAVSLYFWWKGQPFAAGEVFRASRWSAGNRLFPTQVLVTDTAVVHYTPEVVGRKEHSIHIAHVASVSIDTNLLFSNVLIETSGGTTPVRLSGHYKSDAVRIQAAHRTAPDPLLPRAGRRPPPPRRRLRRGRTDRGGPWMM